jgi:DNA-binding transcriptional regulator LsrR (DeoR family)
MLISAEQILAAVGSEDPDRAVDSLELFVEQYEPLAAEGLTREQIGAELGMSASAVAGRLFRARRNGLIGGRREVPACVPVCGTLEAYRRHLRRGESTDNACRRANAVFQQARTGPTRSVTA